MHPDLSLPPWQSLLYFGSLVVLLAFSLKLRRRLGMPVLLPVGLAIAAMGCLPDLTIQIVGYEGIARTLGIADPTDDIQRLSDFFDVLVISRVGSNAGLFFAALGVFLHSRALASREREARFANHSVPSR